MARATVPRQPASGARVHSRLEAQPKVWMHRVVFGALILAILLIALDSFARIMTVEKISAVSLSGTTVGTSSLAPGSREEMVVLPDMSMDARWWVLHTQSMLLDGNLRVRHTPLDNASSGREVHWSSLLMWLLAGMAGIMSFVGEGNAVDYVSTAALWVGPLTLAAFTAMLSYLVHRRWGWQAAIFFAGLFLSTVAVYRTFAAGEADHHGLVLGFALGSMLCALAGGGGVVAKPMHKKAGAVSDLKESEAVGWFRLSGVFGACALWVSAATAIPVIAATAMGGILVAIEHRNSNSELRVCGKVWRIWAGWGAAASFALYLLEYFPNFMGWRLEVNHPVHSMAWWGGGVWLAWLCGVLGEKQVLRQALKGQWRLIPAAAFIALPAVMVVLASGHFFWVRDPFLLALHERYIMEFQSMLAFMQTSGNYYGWAAHYVVPSVVLVSLVLSMLPRMQLQNFRPGLVLVMPAVVVMQALAVYQVRWASAAFAMWIAAAVWLLVKASESHASAAKWIRRGLVLALIYNVVILLGLQPPGSIRKHETALTAPIVEEIGNGILLRDIAHRLIQSSPQALPVVLTGPNSSTQMSYHGRIATLGTLYWENMPGLKHAAAIFATEDPDEVLAQLLARGVTHIVIPSWEDFGNAYASLYALEDDSVDPDAGAPFFRALCADEISPQWLRPFAYPIPTQTGLDAQSVRIFAVLPNQNSFEAAFFNGVYFFDTEQWEPARRYFGEARALRPSDGRASAYLKRIELNVNVSGES